MGRKKTPVVPVSYREKIAANKLANQLCSVVATLQNIGGGAI
jgi:hypothetical protein